MLVLSTLENFYNSFVEGICNNPPTPSSADVIFYPENKHTHCYMRIKNIQNLWSNYSKGDMLLVEDDEKKAAKELNLCQIGNFADNKECPKEGWQKHETCLQEAKIKKEFLDKMNSHIETLSGKTPLCNREVSLNYLYALAQKAQIQAWKNYSLGDLKDCFTNKNRLDERKELLNAMQRYADKSTVDVILTYFPEHQQNLGKRISDCKKSTSGKIHVFNGILHTKIEDATTGAHAKALFDLLEKKNISYYVYHN